MGRSFESMLIPQIERPSRRNELADRLNIQEGISGLHRFCSRFYLSVVGLFLLVPFGGAVPIVQAGENDDVKVLLQLENDMARAWVQRDTQSLEQILADDYTLAGAGNDLIGKTQYIAQIGNLEFETESAIIDDLGVRVYGDAAVVTGRAIYQGRSKRGGRYLRRLRFTDTFIRRDTTWKCVATHASALVRE